MKFLCTTDMPYHSDEPFPVGTDRYLVGQVTCWGCVSQGLRTLFMGESDYRYVPVKSEQRTYQR
jgi:hypothetical protein